MDILILIFATWRTASLIVNEEGPYNLFGRFRRAIGVHFDEYGVPYGENELAKGLACLWCCSVWLGLFWGILYALTGEFATILALPFTLSGGAVLMDEMIGYRNG